MREFLRSKIYRLRVTSTSIDEVDGILIDEFLLQKADILSGEKVLIGNLSNGAHWESFALSGEKFMVSVRGPGSKHCKVGDILIVSAFETSDYPPKPKIVVVDRDNKFEKIL